MVGGTPTTKEMGAMAPPLLSEFGGCFNIHKSHVPEIKVELEKRGINEEFLFPNLNDIKNQIVSLATSRI